MRDVGIAMRRFALTAVIGLFVTPAAHAIEMTGAGATFPYPIYAKWAEAYKAATGNSVNYQSIGSGGGIHQIEAKTVDFGASDMPLTAQELETKGLTQFPAIVGGEVMVVNLPGVAKGQLTLDGPTIADIYLGHITKWNDPAIARLNSGLKLPAIDIAVVERSDGSGTTFVFTNYLSKASPEWKDKVGEATAVQWPTGMGAKGNEGVAANTQRTIGAIGYVEYAYALQNNMTYTKLVNGAAKALTPSIQAFQAAAANADWNKAPGFYLILTDQAGEQSWPITGASFVLVQKRPGNPQKLSAVLDFFSWAFKNGAAMAESLAYVPMPAAAVSAIKDSWRQNIKDASGKPVWTDTGS